MHDTAMFNAIASQAEHGHELAERVRELVDRDQRSLGNTPGGRLADLVVDLIDALATYDYHYQRSLTRRTR
jgi:hypothetical protein